MLCQSNEAIYVCFQVAAVFLFNLLVGVGVLALPAAIAKAGIVAGILCLITVSFMAFISVTFMVEVLATANAWQGARTLSRKDHVKGYPTENKSLGEANQIKVKSDVLSPPLFEIEEKFEMGYMSEMFLGTAGSTFFYAVLCLYLYGVSTLMKCRYLDILNIDNVVSENIHTPPMEGFWFASPPLWKF